MTRRNMTKSKQGTIPHLHPPFLLHQPSLPGKSHLCLLSAACSRSHHQRTHQTYAALLFSPQHFSRKTD